MARRIKAAFDGLRNLQSHSQRNEIEVKETLTQDQFAVAEMVRHGFPCAPTCLAFDPVQKLLAIGTQKGAIRILGRPGVDVYLRHSSEAKVEAIYFLVNEGALISLCADDCLHLWNFRQRRPEVVHSLQFQKEKLTTTHLPFQSKWLYLGTERGNVHVASIESFSLSGYVINWNKAIDLSQKTHPGGVVHLSDCPTDESKLLIGYDRGTIVLWDLKLRQAEARFQCEQALRSVCWHFEGKQFICAHGNGSLSTWSTKKPSEPLQVVFPHSRGRSLGPTAVGAKGQTPDAVAAAAGTPPNSNAAAAAAAVVAPPPSNKAERFRPIQRVEWKHQKSGDEFVIFSGGMPYEDGGNQPCVTVLRGKSIAVLEMEHPIISFSTFCESPYSHDAQDPYAIAVLLTSDLVVVDLTTPGYPCFENPYPMDIHESPVTCIDYLTDCPTDLISHYYSVGSKQKRQGYTDKSWPVKGGEWGTSPSSFPEIVVTGHADGSLKFWDSSSVNLQVLYKLKTSKALDKPDAAVPTELDPFAVRHIALCSDSRQLAIGGEAGQVMFFKFCKQETTSEVTALEVLIPGTKNIDNEPSDPDSKPVKNQQQQQPSSSSKQNELRRQHSVGSLESQSSGDTDFGKNVFLPIKVKGGPQKRPSGYQAELVSLTPWASSNSPETITALALNSAYGVLAYGTERGLAVVDTIQQICIFSSTTADLYGNLELHQRVAALQLQSKQPLTPAMEKIPSTEPDVVNSPMERLENSHASFDFAQSPTTTGGRNASNLIASSSGARLVSTPSLGPNQCGVGGVGGVGGGGRNAGLSPGGTNKEALSERAKSQGSPLLRRPFMKAQSLASADDGPGGHHFDFTHASSAASGSASAADKELNRSRSSSTSSAEMATSESVCALSFIDCYNKKVDTFGPSLWVGTSQGSTVCLAMKIPGNNNNETRVEQQVAAMPTGLHFRLRGSMLCIGFLDQNGNLLLSPADSWKDSGKETDKVVRNRVVTKTKICSTTAGLNGGSAAGGGGGSGASLNLSNDRGASFDSEGTSASSAQGAAAFASSASAQSQQHIPLAVLCSERSLKVYSLTSLNRLYTQKLDVQLLRADIVAVSGAPVVVGYGANGRVYVYSLPSLRLLSDAAALPANELRVIRTLRFANHGYGVYMCSPSEMQKFTVAAGISGQMDGDINGELFVPCNMPEPPKQGFLKELFGGGTSRSVDREELFGEASGKASRSVARHIPGGASLDQVRGQSSSAGSEIMKARLALNERGEKLSEVQERTEMLMEGSKGYSDQAHELMNKYKNKKWYQF